MPCATHFRGPGGELLPIAASELVTVQVPAAGATDLGGWDQAAAGDAYYMQNTFTDAPANCAVLPFCTDPSAITDHGLRIEFDEALQDWVLWIDSLPKTACALTLLFINHSTEDTPCVLPALGVGSGGSSAAYYTVRVPAAGSENMHGWTPKASGGYELLIGGVAWMTADLLLELKSENAALATEHNLLLHQDDGFLDFSIDSLPEKEAVLYIYVPNAVNGGVLNGTT